MLKPSRKILRKEIKKDPLLETFEKIEYGFEKNKKKAINIVIILAVIIIGSFILFNKQKQTYIESNSALGTALVAYSNSDLDNAKFQFESLVSRYEGTKSQIMANYYLGKIAHARNDFGEAQILLNEFLNHTEHTMLVCGAIKLLVDISFQTGSFFDSFEIIDKAKSFNLNNISKLELKLLEISAFIKINDLKSARIELDKILNNNSIPAHIKQKADEFAGML